MTASAPSVAGAVTSAVLSDLLDAERLLRSRLSEDYEHLRDVLLSLVEALAPEIVEASLQRGDDPRGWTPERWERAVPEVVLAAAERYARSDERVSGLESQLADARRRIALLERDLEAARDALRLQQSAPSRLVTTPHHPSPGVAEETWDASATSSSPFPRMPDVPLPEGLAKPRDAYALFVIGETGRARRPWIQEAVAAFAGVKPGSGSIRSVLDRLARKGLVEILRPRLTRAGLVRLTPQGEALFEQTFGHPPVPSRATALIESHEPNGLEHAALALAGAQFLEGMGYHVEVAPPPLRLPDGHLIDADLAIVQEDGRRIFVEAERGLGSADKRVAKWRNLLTYQGSVYIITLDAAAARRLADEVLALGMPGRVYASDLATLKGRAWLVQREIRA